MSDLRHVARVAPTEPLPPRLCEGINARAVEPIVLTRHLRHGVWLFVGPDTYGPFTSRREAVTSVRAARRAARS